MYNLNKIYRPGGGMFMNLKWGMSSTIYRFQSIVAQKVGRKRSEAVIGEDGGGFSSKNKNRNNIEIYFFPFLFFNAHFLALLEN